MSEDEADDDAPQPDEDDDDDARDVDVSAVTAAPVTIAPATAAQFANMLVGACHCVCGVACVMMTVLGACCVCTHDKKLAVEAGVTPAARRLAGDLHTALSAVGWSRVLLCVNARTQGGANAVRALAALVNALLSERAQIGMRTPPQYVRQFTYVIWGVWRVGVVITHVVVHSAALTLLRPLSVPLFALLDAAHVPMRVLLAVCRSLVPASVSRPTSGAIATTAAVVSTSTSSLSTSSTTIARTTDTPLLSLFVSGVEPPMRARTLVTAELPARTIAPCVRAARTHHTLCRRGCARVVSARLASLARDVAARVHR
jgi:hypothetical protein